MSSTHHISDMIAYIAVLLATSIAFGQSDFERGRAFFQHVDVEVTEYLRELETTIKSQSSSEEAKALARCELSMLRDDASQATQVITDEYAKFPNVQIGNLLCRSRLRSKQFKLGEQLCRELVAANPNNSDCQILSAMIRKSVTRELLEVATIDSYGLIAISSLHSINGDFESGSKFAKMYLETNSQGPPLQEEYPYLLLGKSMIKLGKRNQETANALEHYFRIAKQLKHSLDQDAAQLAAVVSACYLIENESNSACEWAREAYALNSESFDSNYVLFQAIMLRKKNDMHYTTDDELCLKCLRKAHSLKPSFHIASDLAKMLWKTDNQRESLALLMPYLKNSVNPSLRAVLLCAFLSQETLSEDEIETAKPIVVSLIPQLGALDHEIAHTLVKRLIDKNMVSEAKTAISRLESRVSNKSDAEDVEALKATLRIKQAVK